MFVNIIACRWYNSQNDGNVAYFLTKLPPVKYSRSVILTSMLLLHTKTMLYHIYIKHDRSYVRV